MTTDSRIDLLEVSLEVSMESLKDEVENLRTDMNARFANINGDMNSRFSEVNPRINTLLVINTGLWIATIGTQVGLFLGARYTLQNTTLG